MYQMKKWVFFLLFTTYSFAQNYYLQLRGEDSIAKIYFSNLKYIKKTSDFSQITKQLDTLNIFLNKQGFLESKILQTQKINDSIIEANYYLGPKIIYLHIKHDKLSINNTTKDTIIKYTKSEEYITNVINQLEKEGFSGATAKYTNFEIKKDTLYTTLVIDNGKKRMVNDIVLKGYDKYPKGVLQKIKRKYQNKTFNEETIFKIEKDFRKLPIAKITKNSETLFTTDSTKIYLYVEKVKNNNIDGFIGFGNNENSGKIKFNGNIDLNLFNNLNSGERLQLNWRNDGNQQSQFILQIETPNIIKSVGLKTSVRFFKQDSTFQNSDTNLEISYGLQYNTNFYAGYKKTTSESIAVSNSSNFGDFTANFFTLGFNHYLTNNNSNFIQFKRNLSLKTNIGSRNTDINKTQQFSLQLKGEERLPFNNRNTLIIGNETFYLHSDSFFSNELFRFGGINSVRGFAENSLQANFYSALLTEYQYNLANNLYINSITDIGYYEDKSINTSGKIIGFGLGFGILNPNSLFKLHYNIGIINNNPVNLKNSIVQISYKTFF
jgi:hypothetical protein